MSFEYVDLLGHPDVSSDHTLQLGGVPFGLHESNSTNLSGLDCLRDRTGLTLHIVRGVACTGFVSALRAPAGKFRLVFGDPDEGWEAYESCEALFGALPGAIARAIVEWQ